MVAVVGWHTITATEHLFYFLGVLPRRLSGEPVQRHSTTASKTSHHFHRAGLPKAKPATPAIWVTRIH
jgi:hypothetical protein